ncbi:hypothetical protein PpBr36_04598, partial [Pyricularia pennisetigena]|uniref:hypothetical protein n=1 Tax=Pyricularia pennisetigena TaxID=1578925 RepID=UPI00114D911C
RGALVENLHAAVRHAEIGRDGLLCTAFILCIQTASAVEEANLTDANQRLEFGREPVDTPDSILAGSTLVSGQQQRGEGGVDDVHTVARRVRAEPLQLGQHVVCRLGEDLDGDPLLPLGAQVPRELAEVADADKGTRGHGDDLFLPQTAAATLDQVEVGVGLVGAIKVDIKQPAMGPVLDRGRPEPTGLDEAL